VSAVAAWDRDDLERALDLVDESRALDPADAGRARRLLTALERLLARSGEPGERERDGGAALGELDRLLAATGGAADAAGIRDFLAPLTERLIEALLDRPGERLAVYGSLRPGEPNHHYLSDLVGEWRDGEVRGRLYPPGQARAFPGVVRDPTAAPVAVELFESRALPDRWERLDAFEAPGYRRVLAVVDTETGPVVANLYVLAEEPALEVRSPTAST